MKSLNQVILEKLRVSSNSPASYDFLSEMPAEWLKEWGRIILHFKNLSALLMFFCEMRGQISDGKYENSSPKDHWEWISRALFTVDGEEFYTGSSRYRRPTKKYNLREWITPIKATLAAGSKNWEIRLYDYGKMGKCLEGMDVLKYIGLSKTSIWFNDELGSIGEIYGDVLRKTPNILFDDLDNVLSSYDRGMLSKYPEFYTEEFFNRFKDTEYTFDEFKADVKSMENTVNIPNYD
jgi:hypothetical protein